MKYKLVLNFYVEKKDDRPREFIEKAMDAFRETFPDAKEVREPFATVSWDEDAPEVGNAIGRNDIPKP